MATVTTPPPILTDQRRSELHRKVCDPLERLRGYIQLYVSLEGLLVLVIYLALWFWIGLALDYGFFKLFTLDWVEVLEGYLGLRLGVLIILLAGLLAVVAFKVVRRLVREFRNSALALVLERRFPELLGDRLITAVELADPRKAAEFGYSQVMVDQTIQQAADRVAQVPIKDAFNWKRLQRYGQFVAAVTLGLYLLGGIGYAALAGRSGRDYIHHFNNVAAIWFERNIQLKDTYWPRQAYIEIVEVNGIQAVEDVKGRIPEVRVGRNISAVPVRVRAVKWVFADPKARGGWRPLRWSDLVENQELFGKVPALPQGLDADSTLDEVELRMKQEAGQLPANVVKDFNHFVYDELTLLAAEVWMHRRLRLLDLPKEITIDYEGEKRASGEMKLTTRDADNGFAGNFTDLKESIKFRAVARDFRTKARQITVVPPPGLAKLFREEERPAYLFHRPPIGGTLDDLKGLKQRLAQEPVYLGDENVILSVPTGTNLKLLGIVDKERPKEDLDKPLLVSVKIIPRRDRSKAPDAAYQVPVRIHPKNKEEGQKFEVEFANITERLDFDFEFKDADSVESRRHIVVDPEVDVAPEVDVFVDVVRKTNQGYLITAQAMVPFSGPARDERGQERFHGRIRDSIGLSKVEYHYTYSRVEAQTVVRARASLAAMAWHLSPVDPGAMALAAGPYIGYVGHLVEPAAADTERKPETTGLPTFAQQLQRRGKADLPRPELLRRLKEPARGKAPLLTEYTLDADREVFDLLKYLPHLRETNPNTYQTRYRLRLWVVATDNNIETGPRSSETKERFSFMVVSEAELLSEIGKETEGLHLKLEQMQAKLKDSRNKLAQSLQILAETDDPKLPEKERDTILSSQATRILEIADVIASGSITAREAWTDFRRIVREQEFNRVIPDKVKKDAHIVELLDTTLGRHFPRAEEANRDFQKGLESKRHDKKLAGEAQARLDELILKVQEILDNMDRLLTIQVVIDQIRKMEEEQRDNVGLLRYLKERLEKELLEDLLNPKKPPADPKKP